MTNQHPITPPEELVQQWGKDVLIEYSDAHWGYEQILCAWAARWGADQELEACCEWFTKEGWHSCHPTALRTARRPKPPSLKQQALAALENDDIDVYLIRRALEALPND
jgi:hypothetical protein